MTKYEDIMQDMTPRRYAELLYKDHFKCYFCAYRGTKQCIGIASATTCIQGIKEWLNQEVEEEEEE